MRIAVLLAAVLALPAAAHARAFDSATLKPTGLGPLRTGMDVGEVAHVLGKGVRLRTFPGSSCATAKLDGRNYMLFESGILRRVTLGSGQYLTAKGIGVGTDQVDIRRAYGKRAKRSPHAYDPDGFYFDVAFGSKAIRFETDGEVVTQIHGGRQPEVSYVEGCA